MKTVLEKNDGQEVSSVYFFGVILALVYLRSKRQVPSTKAPRGRNGNLTPSSIDEALENSISPGIWREKRQKGLHGTFDVGLGRKNCKSEL